MSNPINENLIFVISDLHLADGTGTDDFGNFGITSEREDKLISFINRYNPGKIIANGDIYEKWQVKMKKIKVAHPKIINFLKTDERVHVLVGNHDYRRRGKLYYRFYTKDNKRGLITHGFQVDRGLGNSITRFFSWILGLIEKIIPRIDNFFAKKKVFNEGLKKKVRNYAIKEIEKGYDIVVCAHCHGSTYEEVQNRIYVNTGTCQQGKLEGVLIDTDTGEVKVITE